MTVNDGNQSPAPSAWQERLLLCTAEQDAPDAYRISSRSGSSYAVGNQPCRPCPGSLPLEQSNPSTACFANKSAESEKSAAEQSPPVQQQNRRGVIGERRCLPGLTPPGDHPGRNQPCRPCPGSLTPEQTNPSTACLANISAESEKSAAEQSPPVQQRHLRTRQLWLRGP